MDTNELIKALAADTRQPGMPIHAAWSAAVAAAVLVGAVVFMALLGPRPDIAAAAETIRFPFKFVVTVALAVAALAALRVAARPEAELALLWSRLTIAPALLAGAVVAELFALPPEAWRASLVGTNGVVCLTFIPLIGAGPLTIFIRALRHGAPSHPGFAGALAGLAAGGIAATLYASHCTDDSPLFVATWYTIAIGILTMAGAIAGRRVVRW